MQLQNAFRARAVTFVIHLIVMEMILTWYCTVSDTPAAGLDRNAVVAPDK